MSADLSVMQISTMAIVSLLKTAQRAAPQILLSLLKVGMDMPAALLENMISMMTEQLRLMEVLLITNS